MYNDLPPGRVRQLWHRKQSWWQAQWLRIPGGDHITRCYFFGSFCMFCFACVHLLLFLKFPFELLQVPGEFFTTARIYGIFQPSQGGSFDCVECLDAVAYFLRCVQKGSGRWSHKHTKVAIFCAWDLSFLYLILDFWSMSNSQVDCYFSQSCLHHCVFVGTFRFPGRFVSWWDFFSSGFVWAVCSFNNFCRGKVWGQFGAVSVGTWKDMVFFIQPPFLLFRWWTIFFSVKVGISSKDAVNSMRSELLDLPDCWGELKWWRISQETRLQFFSPSSGWLGCGWSCSFGIFFVEQKVLAQESSRRKNLQRHSLCNCRRQPFG